MIFMYDSDKCHQTIHPFYFSAHSVCPVNDKTVLFQESVRLSMSHGGINNIGETITAGEWGSSCESVGMHSTFGDLPAQATLNVSQW